MGLLYANTLNELDKLALRKKYIAFTVISGLIPILAALSFNLLQSKLGIFAVNTSSFPILVLNVFTQVLFPLYIFSAAADIFSGELGDKTLKLTLTRPISRFDVYLSKILAICVFILINIGISLVISLVSGLFLEHTNSLVGGVLSVTIAFVLAIIPMIFLTIESVFVAQFFKSVGGALITCLIVYITSKIVPFLFGTISKISPFSYLDWHLLWLGSSISFGRILNVFLLLSSYSLIFFGAGYYFFDKKEL